MREPKPLEDWGFIAKWYKQVAGLTVGIFNSGAQA
ncbi:hypothetical protein EMIT0P395_340006 [Pseudomonas sp. IT-P395]